MGEIEEMLSTIDYLDYRQEQFKKKCAAKQYIESFAN
jgi:hypothetical protein